MTATSSNTDLIADPAVSYTSDESTGSLKFTPVADQHGTSTITVTVEDAGVNGIFGTGAFEESVNYDIGQRSRDMAITDINGDGELDAIVSDGSGGSGLSLIHI